MAEEQQPKDSQPQEQPRERLGVGVMSIIYLSTGQMEFQWPMLVPLEHWRVMAEKALEQITIMEKRQAAMKQAMAEAAARAGHVGGRA